MTWHKVGCELYDHGLAQCTKLSSSSITSIVAIIHKFNYTDVLCLFVKFVEVKKII